MRLLFDEQFPFDFLAAVSGPVVLHVHALGWAGVKNGELLRRARDVCDVFVTLDRNLPFQQNLKVLTFGVIVVPAMSNRLPDLLPHVTAILEAAARVRPGEAVTVGV
jgi:hypothetical protein